MSSNVRQLEVKGVGRAVATPDLVIWQREAVGLRLYDPESHEEVALFPGKTYIAVIAEEYLDTVKFT